MTRDDFARHFSAWLRERVGRGRGKMSARALALAIGVDPSNITNWRQGFYSAGHRADGPVLPGRSTTIAIAKALGEDPNWVLLLAGHAPDLSPQTAYRRLTQSAAMAERKLVAL